VGVRFHFGVEDMARLRLVEGPDPLWEVRLSLQLLRARGGPAWLRRWRQQTRTVFDTSYRR
jgi:hypothetical protein